MQTLWMEFLAGLRQPEYLHVLLNPVPVYGLAAGLFSLVVALIARSRGGQGLALTLILVAALSAWPVSHFGDAAYDRVYAMSDANAQKWLNWHAHLADGIVWAYYAAAVLAAASLAGLWKYPRLHRWALPLAGAGAAIALCLGGFLAFVGGKIRHAEFRHGPPPAWANTKAGED